ncbi:MAG: alpha/beta fold hydrolase [Methyloligellaceae bacterium]
MATGDQMPIVDSVEAGSGPLVVLVHSSVAGARQWRRLMSDLEDRFHLIAVNLFGYGRTPAWTNERTQTLDDQAGLVEAALPDGDGSLFLVGHSFGGSVAMKAAGRLGSRVQRLILLEPNPFFLLDQHGRREAFAESMEVRRWLKENGAAGDWTTAAENFADYWGGTGAWAAMPEERRAAFTEALKPNFFEWDTITAETTTLDEWVSILPERTLVVSDRQTVRPIREIVELMREGCPAWRFQEIADGGHMAPLTRPDLINPIVSEFLEGT